MIDLQVIQVASDGTATVGPREPWEVPEPPQDAGEDGAPGEGEDAEGDGSAGEDAEGDSGEDGAGEDGAGEDGGGIPPEVPGSDQAPDPADDAGAARDTPATGGAAGPTDG